MNKIFEILRAVLKKCLSLIILLMILYNIIFFLNTTITQKEYIEVFGISLFSVETDAMEDELYKNDLIIVKKLNINDVFENDIVIWKIKSNIRINKVIEIYNSYEDGKKVYVTKFNKNYQPDNEQLTDDKLIGIEIKSFRYMGILLKVLQSKVTTFIIFVVLLVYYIYARKVYIRYKKRIRKKTKYNNMEIK